MRLSKRDPGQGGNAGILEEKVFLVFMENIMTFLIYISRWSNELEVASKYTSWLLKNGAKGQRFEAKVSGKEQGPECGYSE